MKKIFIFFIFIIFTSSVVAQKKPVTQGTGICNTIKNVQGNIKNNFINIRDYFMESIVDNIHGYRVGDGYKTTAKFPGANASYVSGKIIPGEYIDAEKKYNKYNYTYVAYWGKFKTRTAASQKLEQLKKQVSACLPVYRIKESSEIRPINSILKRYEYIDTSLYALFSDTAPTRIYLQLELYNPYSLYNSGTGEPCIFFRIEPAKPENNKPLTKDVTELETLLKIWENDEGKGDQNKLAKQLSKFNEQLSSIVADYANNFATIKGEMKTTGSKGNFYSKVGLQGADSVYLTQNWTTRRLDFIAVYSKYSSKEEAREKFNELVAQIDKCKFPCCTFAKTDVSENSGGARQSWLPFDLFRKMEPAYKDILLEVEIFQVPEKDEKSEKLAFIWVWSLVLRVTKL